MAFIIDSYNRYDSWDRQHARKTFVINGWWYAIFEVELEWGLPQLPLRIGNEKDPKQFQVYETFDEALRFVLLMKQLN